MEDVCVRICIEGRVQGVFFRKFTKIKADELGIVGFVRNAVNGDVEVFAVASKNLMDQFLAWCHEGSPLSSIKKVTVKDIPKSEEYTRFEIRH